VRRCAGHCKMKEEPPIFLIVFFFLFTQASQLCLEEGDHEYFSYTSFFLLDIMLYAGRHPLEVVAARQKDALEAFRRRKLPMAIQYVNMWRICLAKLLNKIGVDQEVFELI
jgi:hypothetical protein